MMISKATDFTSFYSQTLRKLGVLYDEVEFLYANDAPWPQASFDYPYGQAPEVVNVPAAEMADWDTHVAQYYKDNALGSLHTGLSPFGIQAAEFAAGCLERNGLRGYDEITDDQFAELMCEGLYSKFLEPLNAQDAIQFQEDLVDQANFEYFKSDYSCMAVVCNTWPGEYAAPSIALVRRPRDPQRRYEWEAIAIALSHKPDGASEYLPIRDAPIFRPADPSWWLARYFVLQGAIHRINLIDHVKVHFPSDAINAITKTVLPKWHLIHKLLMPHFRLTLPVNNAVLEGQRSLINRDTWYPWSPFVAKGAEVRRLLPFAWAGAAFYGMDDATDSFPPYRFSLDPERIPDPSDPDHSTVPSFIGLGLSRYSAFQRDYYIPVLRFVGRVVDQLSDPPVNPDEHANLEWLELQHWAEECGKFTPGFPGWQAICNRDTLSRVLAYLIWNAAVVHTSDHASLHKMMNDRPVPFVLRTAPPEHPDRPITTEAVPKSVRTLLNHLNESLEDEGGMLKSFGEWLDQKEKDLTQSEKLIPLGTPGDLTYAKMADLLFYLPHNTTLLYDCDYAFSSDDSSLVIEGQDRPLLDSSRQSALAQAIREFQSDLESTDQNHQEVIAQFGFPKLHPDRQLDKDSREYKRQAQQECIGAGIQY